MVKSLLQKQAGYELPDEMRVVGTEDPALETSLANNMFLQLLGSMNGCITWNSCIVAGLQVANKWQGLNFGLLCSM